MGFVRTFSFSMPRDEADLISPGQQAYTALVGGRKFVTQAQDGLIETSVWRSTNSSGMVNFVIYTEWNSIENMQAYVNLPIIKEMEEILGSDNNPVQINVYEAIG